MATEPRVSPPNSIHMLTRRVLLRMLLLLPKEELVQSFLYILGYLQSKYALNYHNLCVLSDHLHLMLTDVKGDQLQNFLRDFFSLTARSTNCFLDRDENFWNIRKPNCVLLAPLLETLVDKGSYINANHVEAGLVSHSKKWEGLQIRPSDLGNGPIRVKRPRFFFSKRMPKEVEVTFSVPAAIDASLEEVKRSMAEALNRREETVREQFRRSNRKFKGMKAVRRQSRYATARSREEKRTLNPTVACADPNLRSRVLYWLKERHAQYKAKRQELLEGNNEAIFPEGTFVLHYRYGHPRIPWQGCLWRQFLGIP